VVSLLGTRFSSLGVLSFPSFLCQTNKYSQFALLLRPDDTRYIRLVSSHLSTTHRCRTSISAIASCGFAIISWFPAHATAHSTMRPFSHSSADRNLRDNSPTRSLLLSPTMVRLNLSPPQTFPATFWDLVPFLYVGSLALVFTAFLVLLAEDGSNESKVLGEQPSQLTSYQSWFVGLREKERERSMRSQSSYYGYSSVQRNVTGSPALVTVDYPDRPPLAPGVSKTVTWCVSIALGPISICSSTVHLTDTRPHSSTTLAYESITHTSTIISPPCYPW
jgi:hypothetical protein